MRAFPCRRAAVAIGLCTLAFAGCGPSTTDVSGKVTCQGKPLSVGSVTLVSSDGVVHSGEIQSNGTYSIPNVRTGAVKIAVTAPKPGFNKPLPFDGKEGEKPRAAAATDPVVPDSAASPDTSGLTGTVTKGQPLDITIP